MSGLNQGIPRPSGGNETVFAGANAPNSICDVVDGGDQTWEPIVIDRDHREWKDALFGGEALVGRDQGSESLGVGSLDEFVVAEFIPGLEDSAFDGRAAKRVPKGPSQAM